MEGVSDKVAMGSLIKGLKPAIKNELRIWAPTDLGRAMDLAQQIEEKNKALKTSGFGSLYRNTTHVASRASGENISNQTTTKPISNLRSLTESKISEKRSRGLCYRCDEKWHRNHRCKTQINVILVDEVVEAIKEVQFPTPSDEIPARLEFSEVESHIEVSLNSTAGLTSPKTMKLPGKILNQPVVALIDPGATHNFIASKLVEDLGLPVKDTEPYGV